MTQEEFNKEFVNALRMLTKKVAELQIQVKEQEKKIDELSKNGGSLRRV